MLLKDIGWTVAEASDYGDTEFAAYGTARDLRVQLVCAIHPHGWQGGSGCPDWLGAEP